MDKNYKYRAFILPELLGKPTVNYFGSSQGVHSHGMLNGSLLAYPRIFLYDFKQGGALLEVYLPPNWLRNT